MTTDDFLRTQRERSQLQQTRRRREGRSRRRQIYLLGGLAFVGLVVLGAPSLVSHTSLGRSILARTAARYDLDADATSVRIGWITPLRISGLRVHGASGGSDLSVDQIDAELTVIDLLRSPRQDFGEVTLRGANLLCTMNDGRCSLEDDWAAFTRTPSEGKRGSGTVKIQDTTISITDSSQGGIWESTQSSAEVVLAEDHFQVTFAGVVSERAGSGGSVQGNVEWAAKEWHLDIESESLPLSVMSLIRRRFPEFMASIPGQLGGDVTGTLHIAGKPDGAIEASAGGIKIRDMTAAESGSPLWTNQLATVEGDFVLEQNRIVGRSLRATTDFASMTIDGAFSRSLSFGGTNDNPLRWLETLDGSASAEIDLAALDLALPGLLPLKDDAEIVSGRAIAQIHSLPMTGGERRCELTVRSEELRARTRVRAVTIDPFELQATVSTHQGSFKAEQFQWNSSFASAVGKGDLRSGTARFKIDFGRLSSTLRPIFDISGTTLGGSAAGNVRWNASDDHVWRLTGSGKATELLVTLPSGRTFQRPTLRGDVEAVGRWGGKSLDQLSKANITLSSTGLDFHLDLLQPVDQPSSQLPFPVRLEGSGRIESLVETLSPWLPKQIRDAEGGFTISARGEASAIAGCVTNAAIELTEPRIAYANRYFRQPSVKLLFDGDYQWPSADFKAQSLTIAGDAFSAVVQGVASPETIDLKIKWRAKLERLQQSSRTLLAARTESAVRQVGYQSGQTGDSAEWLVRGECHGEWDITNEGDVLHFDSLATAKNIALLQPPSDTVQQPIATVQQPSGDAASSATGVSTGKPGGGRSTTARGAPAVVVWSEPNLRVEGLFRFDRSTGRLSSESMKVAGDWFASNLQGHLLWNESAIDLQCKGPSRLKMPEVAKILSLLVGTEIRAEGIHETPLEIRATRQLDGPLALTVVGDLGWELASVGGMEFGAASLPFRLTETSLHLPPTAIPVGQGQLNLGGEVHYRPGPLWMQVKPGVVARSVRLTPEITNGWLKYLAPLVAGATNVDGTVSVELDEAIVHFEQPELCRVTGRVNIEGAKMTAGPLANQIINGMEQLRAIALAAGALDGAGVTEAARLGPANRTLIEMPAQTVDITIDQGVVSHKTLFFEVDRAQVVTSGQVTFDGRLDMVAQIPLHARWLGSELQGLAGQSVSLPIGGTLSSPSLDSRGVRKVVSQLGVGAAQSTAENYLQQQINRGMDKIFGR